RTPEISDLLKVDLLLEEFGYLDQRGIAPPPESFASRYSSIANDAKMELYAGLGIDVPDDTRSDLETNSNLDTKNESSKSEPELIGRYEVIRLLGKGAFGKVFLAKDPELDRSVAIKVPTNKRIRMGGGTEEYLAEARAVAKLEHPNIVPVYDCGTTKDDRCFVVSKFIRGKELRAEIRKGLSHRESAMIACSLARALHVAHVAGIVHRDVKPGNVIIDSNRQPHLLDFGLALSEKDSLDGDALVGTPAYMSPEQAEGGNRRIDGRSDIYSLAVVLYEMLTGHRPYKSDNTDELIAQLKQGEVRPPRQSDDSIPVELEQVCLKALSRKLSDRFNTAKDMADELESWLIETNTEGDSTGSLDSHRSWSSRKQIPSQIKPGSFASLLRPPVSIFLGLGILGLTAILVFSDPPWESKSNVKKVETAQSSGTTDPSDSFRIPTADTPARIAVLGFRNLSGDAEADWLSLGLAELLTEELQKSPEFEVVSIDDSSNAKIDLDLSDSDSLGSSALNRINQRLDTEWIVVGSWDETENEETEFFVNLQSAARPDSQLEFTVDARNERWIDACPSAAAKIRQHLHVRPPDISAVGAIFPSVPKPDAASAYFKGIDAIRRFQPASAIELLNEAQQLDSESALIHDRLSQALKLVGNESAAKEHAAKAVELSQSLPQWKQLAMQGELCLLNGETVKAASYFRSLFDLRNRQLEDRLRLASALVKGGRGHEALKLIEEIDSDSVSTASSIDLNIAAAKAAQSVSSVAKQVELAGMAIASAKVIDARIMEAHASLVQGEGFRRLAKHDEAALCYERSLKIFRENKDDLNAVTTLTAWGKGLIDNGQLDMAEAKVDEALKLSESIKNNRLIAKSKSLLGEIAIYRGEFDQATKRLRDSLQVYIDSGDQIGIAGVNLTLANVMARSGKLEEALNMVGGARKAFQAAGNRLAEARTWGQEGAMRGRAGDANEAQRYFQRALELFKEVGDQRSTAICLGDLASTYSNNGNLTRAGELYSEALELHRQIGSKRGPEMVMFNLSNLYARTGRFDESYKLMNESFERFKESGKWMNAVFIQRKLADVQLKRGNLKPAVELLSAALEKSKEIGSLATQAQSLFLQHNIDLFTGNLEAAIKSLKESRKISEELNQE
ncbi:MAG: tetratricopeptide repeat protein, partial [Planctomycetota bacterium]